MRHVIIGGSIAGISAAKEIRGNDPKAEITVISAEKTRAYYRPMIPVLIEKEGIDITFVDDPIGKYAAEAVYGTVRNLEVSSRQVVLSSGKKRNYDKLLIATGSRPLIPDLEGLGGVGVFTLRTMEDAIAIKSSAKNKRHAVVIGGGFVGTKASIALHHLGLGVTLIELSGQVLPQRLDRRSARIVADIMRKNGIEIMANDTVSEIMRSSGGVKSVRLASGAILEADIVVIAIGTRPNIDLVNGAGIKTDRGILVNESLQTSAPDVYAAGDAVEYVDLLSGKPAVSALWTNAEEMGRIAGRNMAGGNIKYQGFLSVMNAAEIFGVPIMSAGLIDPEEKEYETIIDDTPETYRKLVFKGDVLVGVIFIGEVSNAGIYTNLIKNKIPIGSLKEEAMNGTLGYINFVSTVPVHTLSV